jgi:hypothetical protein
MSVGASLPWDLDSLRAAVGSGPITIVCRRNLVGRCQQEGGRSLSPLVVTRARRRSWGARPTIYRYRMPVRLENAAEIGSAALIVYVAEIESASVNNGDAWASKEDADQLRSINGDAEKLGSNR